MFNRFLIPAIQKISVCQVLLNQSLVGSQFRSLIAVIEALAELSSETEDEAQSRVISRRKRIQFLGTCYFSDSFFQADSRRQRPAVPQVRDIQIAVQCHSVPRRSNSDYVV